jgi:hypothetical protein
MGTSKVEFVQDVQTFGPGEDSINKSAAGASVQIALSLP